jgi:hypothetical protein
VYAVDAGVLQREGDEKPYTNAKSAGRLKLAREGDAAAAPRAEEGRGGVYVARANGRSKACRQTSHSGACAPSLLAAL